MQPTDGTRQDGRPVRVTPSAGEVGQTEGVWPADGSPDGQAEIIARMEAFEPLEMSADDEAELQAARAAVRKVTLDAMRDAAGPTR